MSCLFFSRRLADGVLAAALFVAAPVAPALAEEPAKPATPAAQVAKPTITKLRCKGLKLEVTWQGSGVGIVDYLSTGEKQLQERKDPAPTDTRVEVTLGSEWKGRHLDVRIWDKDAKLLDSKSVDCTKNG